MSPDQIVFFYRLVLLQYFLLSGFWVSCGILSAQHSSPCHSKSAAGSCRSIFSVPLILSIFNSWPDSFFYRLTVFSLLISVFESADKYQCPFHAKTDGVPPLPQPQPHSLPRHLHASTHSHTHTHTHTHTHSHTHTLTHTHEQPQNENRIRLPVPILGEIESNIPIVIWI